MIVQDEGNNGGQAGKKHVPDEFFPYRLLLPLNSHGTSPDRHFAGQRTQQNRESSNGPHAPKRKLDKALRLAASGCIRKENAPPTMLTGRIS
jgi:hypothetical protein